MAIKTNQETNTTQQTGVKEDIKIAVPKDYEVHLQNSNDVAFEAVSDVLAEVLEINTARAMMIAMRAHTMGSAPVFKGPRDMAETHRDALMGYAAQRAGEEDPRMGYARLNFTLVECDA